jgi:hypothetical protein
LRTDCSKNIEVFRKRVSANLRSDMGDSLEFVVSGDHKFENSEYRRLDFQRLQYDSHGDLVQWDKILEEPQLLPVVGGKAIELPPLYCVIFVVIFGYIGSILREFSRQPPENVRHFIGRMMSPISTLIDPAISLIVFGCLFLIMLFTKRNLLEIGGDALLIYKVGSALVGVISGFLGLRALYEVIKYLGIKIEEKDITG